MDITTISTGLASIQSAIELTKFVAASSGTLDKAESKLKLAELLAALAEAKIQLASAGMQISELQECIDRRSIRESLSTFFVDGVYVILGSDGKAIDGPFCGRCLDVDHRQIRPANDRSGERGMGYCPECKNKYPLWNAEQRLVEDGARSTYTG